MASVEHETLNFYFDKLSKGISLDPVGVSTKLLSKGLVSNAQVTAALLNKGDDVKATELVLAVGKVVDLYPKKFLEFLDVLNSFPVLKDLVIEVHKTLTDRETKVEEQKCHSSYLGTGSIGRGRAAAGRNGTAQYLSSADLSSNIGPEGTANWFTSQLSTLTDRIVPNLGAIATNLLSKFIISKDAHEAALNEHNSASSRTVKLLIVVAAKIRAEPHVLKVFLQILESDPSQACLVNDLVRSYNNMEVLPKPKEIPESNMEVVSKPKDIPLKAESNMEVVSDIPLKAESNMEVRSKPKDTLKAKSKSADQTKKIELPLEVEQFTRYLLKLDGDSLTGKGTRLAIIDEGFNNKLDTFKGYNKFTFKQPPTMSCSLDSLKHGTAVAAIAAGKKSKSFMKKEIEVLNYPGGIAPEATVTCYTLTDKNSMYQLLKEISEAKPRFDVVSISICSTEDLKEIIEVILKQGTIIFAGSGNTGEIDPIGYPACLDGVVSVGSLDKYGNPSKFTRKTPPIADVHVYGEVLVPTGETLPRDNIAMMLDLAEGTSFATPAAAGLACLAIQYYANNIDSEITDDIHYSLRKEKMMSIFQSKQDVEMYKILAYKKFMDDVKEIFER